MVKSYLLIKTLTTTEMTYVEEIALGETVRSTEKYMTDKILNDGDIIPVVSNQRDVDIVSARIIDEQELHNILDEEQFYGRD